jgi:hypothetical protein
MEEPQNKKLGPWLIVFGLVALALIGAGVGLIHWAGNTAKELKATAPSEKPMFLEGTPQAYLYEWVESDFRGQRLEGANWLRLKDMVVWPNEPNWDHAYVISSYRLQSGPVTTQEANIEVTYDTLGELDTEVFTYEHSPSRQTVPFLMLPHAGRWRVGSPRLQPHVGPEAAIEYLQRMAINYKQYRKNIDASIAAIRADVKATEHH